MKTNKLVIGETYYVKAIEIQKNLTLTKIKNDWLYFQDISGFKYAVSKGHSFLIEEIKQTKELTTPKI